jgi:glycine dehydrogenase
MAGLRVMTVPADEHGDIDVEALAAIVAEHADRLSVLMVTYPSTHGVFETRIREVCDIVHASGGQVYVDGANLNAMVGLSRLADLGADVSHINLHKTFCIPHGGGGPGMGPIGVKRHLAPFLPTHPLVEDLVPDAHDDPVGAVSAGPWGSASILPISYAYIAMMSGDGLTRASKIAILNANYIAKRLRPHFPILFESRDGYVAHECIIDLRHLKPKIGLTVEDVAKRLVDYGFHAPTMSWPVPETMMIEPTESESRHEIDRFCDAMIAIRREIAEIENSKITVDDSPLRHAPHHVSLIAEPWSRSYTPSQAFFPLGDPGIDKFWPPVSRVDNVHGDRHLQCRWPEASSVKIAAE